MTDQLCNNIFECNGTRRRKLEGDPLINKNKFTKEEYRKIKMNELKDKYFEKIANNIIKASESGNNELKFYYNYYHFVNNGLGKPHGFLNEFMTEMCYEYSEFIVKDGDGNPITFRTLFGTRFKWELRGKNMIILSW